MVIIRLVVTIAILMLGARTAGSETSPWGDSSALAPFQSACRALLGVLSGPVLERVAGTFLFSPQADGGGDGGDGGGGGDGTGSGGTGDGAGGTGTGGTGDGATGTGTGGTGDGTGGAGTSSDGSTSADSGTGDGNSGEGDSNGDGPSTDPGAVGAPGDQSDPGNANDAPADDAEAPADPSAVTSVDNPDDVADVPTNDPALGLRGPGSSANGPENSTAIISAGPVSAASVDVGINAVIVSGARTPWEAIGKGPGVQNVIVTGGIIALGETAFAEPPPGVLVGAADNPPVWLEFKPNLRYLNGSVFPPVVPNVIDIRTISNTEEAIGNESN